MKNLTPKLNTPALSVFFIWILATAFWWAFAFFQLPTPDPDWLDRAREVCFGKTETGLPELRGWLTLIIPPLFLIISFYVAFKNELTDSLKIFFKLKAGFYITSLIVFFLSIEIILITKVVWERWPKTFTIESSTSELPENYPKTSIDPLPFDLIDQNNEQFSHQTFINKKTILTFAFANCDTICPLIIKNSIQALNSKDPNKYQLVVITLDPWRDRPSRLKTALEMWDAPNNSYFLSGEIDQVTNTLQNFKVPFERNLKTGFVTHPALVYIINEQGKIAFSFNNPNTKWLKEALNRI